jgi:PAS domain S-box-containing protein
VEEELRSSHQRMRLATEATGVAIWEWNVLTNRIRWDAEMFRIYGVAPTPDGFVTYKTWRRTVLPEDLAVNEAVLQDTVRRRGQSSRTFRIRRGSDGEVRNLETVEIVRTNAQGQAEWVVGTNLDITERKHAEEVLRRSEALTVKNVKLESELVLRQATEKTLQQNHQHQRELLDQTRRFAHDILRVQEEERQTISRELHDVIAQTLTGINIRLAALKKEAAVDTRNLDRNIALTQRLVEKSVDTVHQFARELRPAVLDDLGLIPALHSFMKSFTTRTGVRTSLKAAAKVEQLDMAQRTVLFRVAQEALNNVARHAKASRVTVSIQKLRGGIVMKIKDDGKSFRVDRALPANGGKRLGLVGMRERVEMVGGKFFIASAPGQGTTIEAHLSLGKKRGGGFRSRRWSPIKS